MRPRPAPVLVPGDGPIVLVAPHAGRRDATHRPWGEHPLKVNDLHTGELTHDLAARLGAAAIINPGIDRNEIDLNRLSAAHDAMPAFLEDLARVLEATIARHGRATVLTIHGWNVSQPAIDIGLGCTPDPDPLAVGPAAAVSAAFAAHGIGTLARHCTTRGIAATIGARYPARAKENLLQLFTPRHRDDPRPLVQRLVAMGPHVDAAQLELSLPLRLPGVWRERAVAALVEARTALEARHEHDFHQHAWPEAAEPFRRRSLELATDDWAFLVATDPAGARLLLFPPDGGLYLFTAEFAGAALPLQVETPAPGNVVVRFDGPMLRFPDTTPFLDLEEGLARAQVVAASLRVTASPIHTDPAGRGDFVKVTAEAQVDGRPLEMGGVGWTESGSGPLVWPRLRGRLRTGEGEFLTLSVPLEGGEAEGFLCSPGGHDAVVRVMPTIDPSPAAVERVQLAVELDSGRRFSVQATPQHRLPVVRGGSPHPVRLLFASCQVGGYDGSAGWVELGGI